MKNKINVDMIKNYLTENKLSNTAFCKVCKISPSTLNKIISNKDNFRIIALLKIARVIKVQVHQLFT